MSGELLRTFPETPLPKLWSLAIGRRHDRLVAVTAGDLHGGVRLWDALTWRPLGDLAGHTCKVEAITLGEHRGRPVAVTGDGPINPGDAATVRVWDLADEPASDVAGVSRVRPSRGALVTAEGEDLVVRDAGTGRAVRRVGCRAGELAVHGTLAVTLDDGVVRTWDLETGRPGHRLDGGGQPVRTLATGALGERVLAAVLSAARPGGDRAEVHVWDATTGRRLRRFTGDVGIYDAVALGAYRGRGLLITGSGGSDRVVRVRDLATGRTIHTLARNDNYIKTISVEDLLGRPVLVTGGGNVCLWDLADGALISAFGDHMTLMTQVRLGEIDGRPVAVTISIGSDRRIAVWRLPDGEPLGSYTGQAGWLGSVDLATVRGLPTVVAPADDGSVHLWEPVAGTVTRLPFNAKVRDVLVTGGDLVVATDTGLARLHHLERPGSL
ncbi:WD40 repeat domain-containing protein [Nonomuraea antimicrobica]